MGWATDEANRIAERQRSVQDARRWELHVAEIIKRDAKPFFERTCEQIEQDVSEFNQAHGKIDPIYYERFDCDHIAVSRRDLYPRALVELGLDPFAWQVKLRECHQSNPLGQRQESKTLLNFSVDQKSNISLDSTDIDGISKQVLTPILDAYREL